jgi:hypothetical protein
VLGAPGRAQGGSGKRGEHGHGHGDNTGAPTAYDGMAWRWCDLAPASNRTHPRAGKGKIEAKESWLPRKRTPGPLNGGTDTARPWVNGDGAPAAQ